MPWSANFVECFVTLNGTRHSMLMAKEFEGKASINTREPTAWAIP